MHHNIEGYLIVAEVLAILLYWMFDVVLTNRSK
jgi:hypothetical protein